MNNDKPGDYDRASTERRLWELFEKIKKEKRPTGPSDFAREAGISRSYLYTFNELAREVAKYGRTTQPQISRRGAGVSKTQAKKRDIDERVRREHTKWAKELPKLRQENEEANDTIETKDREIEALKKERNCLGRLCELLLMLASEAGASLVELEKIREIAASTLDLEEGRDLLLEGLSILKSDVGMKPN
jgi:predicted RNase H-like nuclease (RuvC/YqgF family)